MNSLQSPHLSIPNGEKKAQRRLYVFVWKETEGEKRLYSRQYLSDFHHDHHCWKMAARIEIVLTIKHWSVLLLGNQGTILEAWTARGNGYCAPYRKCWMLGIGSLLEQCGLLSLCRTGICWIDSLPYPLEHSEAHHATETPELRQYVMLRNESESKTVPELSNWTMSPNLTRSLAPIR